MEVIAGAAQQVWNLILSLRFWDVLDILVIAYLVYRLLLLVRRTNTSRLLKGVLLILLALWLSSGRLRALNYLLSHIVDIGILALLILFQPEIRRVLEQMGSSRWNVLEFFARPQVDRQSLEQAISQTVAACGDMSRSRTGALIVFERHIQLDEVLRSGTKLDAEVSSELLKNIFFVKAPHARRRCYHPAGPGVGGGMYAPPEPECESEPGSGYAPPGRHRHERELRRGGGPGQRGDRFYLRGRLEGCSSAI